MGTVLTFNRNEAARSGPPPDAPCEIVIFPGVRIERETVDLSHRLRPPSGGGDFGGKRRRRKTS